MKPKTSVKYIFQITIVAQAIDAEPVLTAQMTITIEFVDLSAPPVFTDLSQTISFRENTTDLSEEFYTASFKGILPELDHDLVAFYMIHGENYGEFQIDDNTVNKITVINILDRETTPFYTIEIQTASTSTGVSDPGKDSVLLLTIEVRNLCSKSNAYIT